MNGTASIIVPATVTEIGDGPYFYASCQVCYSKLIQTADAYSCLKCHRDVQPNKVAFRYRLTMTLMDSSTFIMVTGFGGMLNAFFGCPAAEFNSRWIKPLKSIVGSLEQPVMKWAVEQTFVGSHLHFGFKIPLSFLYEQKKQGNTRISLRDVVTQSCHHKSLSSQTNTSLVATQIITQDNSQFPAPVTLHMQDVFSAFKSLNGICNITDSHWLQVRQFFQMKYARQRQNILSQTSHFIQDSVEVMHDYTSDISSLDQTSFAFSCDAYQSLGSSHSVITSQASASGMESTNTAMKTVNISSENNSQANSNLYARPSKNKSISCVDTMSSLGTSNEDEFVKECKRRFENDVDDQNSILLFENSDSLYGKETEMPLKDINTTQSLMSGVMKEKDLSDIEDEQITEFPSEDLNLSFHFCNFKDESIKCDISLPSCQPVNYGLLDPGPQSSSKQLVLVKDYEFPITCIANENYESQNEHYKNTRFSSPKMLKARRHSSMRASSIKSKETYSVLADKSEMDSLLLNEIVNQYSLLDMPESEDLDVFLAAVSNSTGHPGINKSNNKDSIKHQEALTYGKRKSDNVDASENFERLELEINSSNVFHNEKDELKDGTKGKRGFIDGDLKNYDMVSEHLRINGSPSTIKNNVYEADSPLELYGHDFASDGDLSFEGQNASHNNISCDLFSSQDSMGSVASNVFKRLSITTKSIAPSDTSKPVKKGPNFTVNGPVDDTPDNIDQQLQDHSYDLFSTPSSKIVEEISFDLNSLRPHSCKFNSDCDSFDLFSSSEEET